MTYTLNTWVRWAMRQDNDTRDKCRWIDSVHPREGGREFVGSVDR